MIFCEGKQGEQGDDTFHTAIEKKKKNYIGCGK